MCHCEWVLRVWTQVESKELWRVTFVYNLRQWIIYNKLTFARTFLPLNLWREIVTFKKLRSEFRICKWITPEHEGEGLTCSAIKKLGLSLHPCIWLEQIKEILVFLQFWWFDKRKKIKTIEALIQCLVLVLENPFNVMPCINPLSIVRYTMGDKSLSDHLFRLRPVKYTLYPNV